MSGDRHGGGWEVNFNTQINGNVGQHIDHVEHIHFSMDSTGQMSFASADAPSSSPAAPAVVATPCPSDAQLARAIRACSAMFWGASAYAVAYRVMESDYALQESYPSFEARLRRQGFSDCTEGTLSNGFRNKFMLLPIEEWPLASGNRNVAAAVKLAAGLRRELKAALRQHTQNT